MIKIYAFYLEPFTLYLSYMRIMPHIAFLLI